MRLLFASRNGLTPADGVAAYGVGVVDFLRLPAKQMVIC